jgi:NDP-sugar pyrophosphorylase family protein
MADSLPPICILAGGLGTRLGSRVRDTPKPLLEVAGEPFLIHQLRLLAKHGARRAVISVGYLGDRIERQIGRERFGVTLQYSYDGPSPLGTLGAVRNAIAALGDRFLVLYGDTYLRIDYAEAARAWSRSELPAMMTVLRNQGQWDTSNASFDGHLVSSYDKRSPDASMEWIDYGLGGLTTAALAHAPPQISELADLYHELASRKLLFGYRANERFYEIGTPRALIEADAFLRAQQLACDQPALDQPPRGQRTSGASADSL